MLDVPRGAFVLTYNRLDPETSIRSAQDCTAGAIAVFIGTTRNFLHGTLNSFVSSEPSRRLFQIPSQTVARLEYQAYNNDDKDDDGHPTTRSRKRNSV